VRRPPRRDWLERLRPDAAARAGLRATFRIRPAAASVITMLVPP
jgi:hypothetical protein